MNTLTVINDFFLNLLQRQFVCKTQINLTFSVTDKTNVNVKHYVELLPRLIISAK